MVINIVTKLDVSKLKSEIFDFEKHNEKRPSYLIMHENTYKELKKEFEATTVIQTYGNWNTYSSFYGIPIAICKKMDFGEIDLV